MVHPVALAPAAREYALEQLQSLLLLPQLAVKAGRIDQGTHVVGIQVERAARPLEGTRNLTIMEKGRRAERQRTLVEPVQHEHVLCAANALSRGRALFLDSSEHTQRLRLQNGALKTRTAYGGLPTLQMLIFPPCSVVLSPMRSAISLSAQRCTRRRD